MPPRVGKFELDKYVVADEKSAYLGEGTYGTVIFAKEKATGRPVAIKQIHREISYERGLSATVLRETTMLRLLTKSPYVVRLLDVEHHPSSCTDHDNKPQTYMIFEHLNTDLCSYMSRNYPINAETVKRFMYHILLGLYHCQSLSIMHRDLKPQNILLDLSDKDQPTAKLGDFGFGRGYMAPIPPFTDEIITLWYRPPEVLLGYRGHTPYVDIWSAACIFAQLYEKNILFQGHTETEQLTKIFETLGSPTLEEWKRFNWCEAWRTFPNFKKIKLDEKLKQMPKDAIALLERMLSYDPLKRPSAEDCLRDPYFADIFQETDLDLSHFRINDRNGAMRTATPSPSPSQTTPITTNRGGVFNGVFGSRTNIA